MIWRNSLRVCPRAARNQCQRLKSSMTTDRLKLRYRLRVKTGVYIVWLIPFRDELERIINNRPEDISRYPSMYVRNNRK